MRCRYLPVRAATPTWTAFFTTPYEMFSASAEKVFTRVTGWASRLWVLLTERGAQQASTQEAYDLVGNNYYNPNWGYPGRQDA